MKSDKELLLHINDEMSFLIEKSSVISKDAFLEDEILKRAFARSFEIIGEAVKNLSQAIITQNANVEWRKLAGLRDKLIHGYFSVDYVILWDAAVNNVPQTKQFISKLIDDFPSNNL